MRAVNTINPPKYTDLTLYSSLFLKSSFLDDLLCQHCKCIPNQPLELIPCRHLICISCISKITESRTLTCTCNPKEVGISIPHPLVLNMLGSLLLKCPRECGEVIELGHLEKHLASNCSHTYTPPLSQITVEHLLDSSLSSTLEQYTMAMLAEKFIPSSGSVTYRSPSGKVCPNNINSIK